MEDDPLRPRQEERERVFCQARVVRARVSAHRHARRNPVVGDVVDSRQHGLDELDARIGRGILGELPGEANAQVRVGLPKDLDDLLGRRPPHFGLPHQPRLGGFSPILPQVRGKCDDLHGRPMTAQPMNVPASGADVSTSRPPP